MIKNINIAYRDERDLSEISPEILAHPNEQMLIQVFAGTIDKHRIQVVVRKISALFPHAALIGVSSTGEIIDGDILDQAMVISITCFEKSFVRAGIVKQNDDISLAGHQLAASLSQENVKALIVFGCNIKDGKMVDAEPALYALSSHFPDATISGGQAGDDGSAVTSFVFTRDDIVDNGFAAVSIAGEYLDAHNTYNVSWVPVGKTLTVTKVDGSRVYEIDGETPVCIYEHYLGKEVVAALPFSATEFPLMLDQSGRLISVHIAGVNPDGSCEFTHRLKEGDLVRFAYCHAGLLAQGAHEMQEELLDISIDVAFVYSCVSRKWIFGKDVAIELATIRKRAPIAGFYCHGEHFGQPRSAPASFGQTITVLCLSEKKVARSVAAEEAYAPTQLVESRQFKTMRALHHLLDAASKEVEKAHAELAEMARKDYLTTLANRRLFIEAFSDEIARHKHALAPLSLILLDIDHFKLYNDTYGHLEGDACLRMIASGLLQVTGRPADLVARIGGEEFAILLPNTTFDEAIVVAQRVRQCFAELSIEHSASPISSHITASQGVVSAKIFDISKEELMRVADKQLYLAKGKGRNEICGIDLMR